MALNLWDQKLALRIMGDPPNRRGKKPCINRRVLLDLQFPPVLRVGKYTRSVPWIRFGGYREFRSVLNPQKFQASI